MRFYTWKDIERYILMHHDEWKDELYDIEVYPNEMVVYPKSEQGTLQNAVLKKLFPKNIAPDNLSIKLDGQGEDLMILSAQSGEVCLGVVSQQQEELLPGEILLKSSGGASIRLCNDGTILLNGKKVE